MVGRWVAWERALAAWVTRQLVIFYPKHNVFPQVVGSQRVEAGHFGIHCGTDYVIVRYEHSITS